MKPILLLILLKQTILSALLLICGQNLAMAAAKPNIVIILFDDLGYGDLSCQGATDIATPHIDRLAKYGVRFTRAYANGAFCTPTRAALIGCRYQQRFGVEGLATSTGLRNVLPTQVNTLPERLLKTGYKTHIIGKWHLGDQQSGCRPQDQGFEKAPPAQLTSAQPLPTYLPLHEAALAASFIERQRDDPRPFFLYLAFHAVHVPITTTEGYLARVPGIADKMRREYAATLTAADDGVGAVLAALEKSGKLANTLVICTSDNGGPTTRNGVNGSQNTPLRGSKCETFEGGIRVPLVIHWPGVIAKGSTYGQPVISFDLSATAIAAAKADAASIDGVDLRPYLTGEKSGMPHKALFWRSRDMENNHAALQGDWKFVNSTVHELAPDGRDRTYAKDPPSRKTPGREMLFNLADDPREQHDLAGLQPAKLMELKKLYEAWSAEVDADAATFKR